ncbi:2-dehydropantoate 2-reductase [Cognatishimia sp. SS12]|uniref:ketopantoate reductase family protein n=1 Tax=Cognatishimia sp. SS12 TaxID=2979465 RepID=UPI00232DC72F|nr:2-dehydropantoate 2-reductase [Cognatishimia sp. SS12]MDC0739301.1 2-dehydropantoate 2-reductase [Cognatishimia sp. SS12]
MKIAVLGAGAMGSVFGARLAKGGADVTLLDVNDAHLTAINEGGLQVDLDEGAEVISLPALRPEAFKGPVDLVLLFTKTFHTEAALRAIAPQIGAAHVLSLQNGIGNAERLQEHLPAAQILLGMTMTPAEFIAPGKVASHGPAATAFYSLDGTDRPILHQMAEALRHGGIEAVIDPQIQAAIWEKAAFNCAMNALCALTDGTPGAIGVSKPARALASEVAREAISVANALTIPADLTKVEALMSKACAHHLMHEPSMLQDRKAGRRTEIDALNGAVATQGERLGLQVPVNRTLASLVHLFETAVPFRASHLSKS